MGVWSKGTTTPKNQKEDGQEAKEHRLYSKAHQHLQNLGWAICCSAEELKGVIQRIPDNEKKIVKTELSFYVHTHKADRLGRPELFKLSNIDTATMLKNLYILLVDEDNSASRSSVAEISLPTIEDALRVILSANPRKVTHSVYEVNEACVNVWYEGDKVRWYIGFFKSIKSDNRFHVEQLVRVKDESDLVGTSTHNHH